MRSQRPPYQAPPAAAANARDGYAADRTMLPGAAAPSGAHSEDCSCPACETHRTFHALLRGSDPPKHAGSGRPLRRRPAPEWDASEACMFVHSVENMIQATGVPTAEHHHTARQRLIAGANIGPMSLATRCTKTQLHLLSPSLLLQPSTGSMQSLRPPRGLEDIGMMAGVRERGRL
eukprot:s485_g17.t1